MGENGTTREVTVSSQTVSIADHFPLARSPRVLCCATIQAIAINDDNQILGISQALCGQSNDIVPGPVVNLSVNESSVGTNSFVAQWDNPSNYESIGLSYEVSVSRRPIISTSEQFIFIGNLDSCTEYMVTVTSMSSMYQSSENRTVVVKTMPTLPPTPANLQYSFNNSSETLILTWGMPGIICATQRVTNYRVNWGCEGINRTEEVPSSSYNISLISRVNYGLCYATVQSCDNYGRCSRFSKQEIFNANMVPPPTLLCYSYTEYTNDIRVAFLFPSPFATSQLRIKWTLVSYNTRMTEEFFFTDLSSNVLNVTTESDTQYDFYLLACNIYGCGSPCYLNFSTSVSNSYCSIKIKYLTITILLYTVC